MSLFENESIDNLYHRMSKKSIYLPARKDMVLIFSILILIISPFGISFFSGLNKEDIVPTQIYLYISPRFEELFGKEITEKLIQEFEENHPDLLIGELTTQEPDILVFDEGEYSGLIADGVLLSLTPEPEHFALPLVSFMDLLFYNIELLQAAGFDRPPKTRDEFIAYARAVSGEGVSGTALGLSAEDKKSLSRDVFSWLWAAGNNFWPTASQGMQGPVINTRPIIADFTFLGRLQREGILAPDSFDKTGEQRLDEFAQGKIALIIASSSNIPALREKMGDDAFGITTIPGTDAGGKYSIGISSLYVGISAVSSHSDEALIFLEFLVEQSMLLCAELKAVPGVVSDIIFGDYVRDDPFYSKARDIFYSAEILHGFSGKPGALEYENAVLEELKVFFETNRTAQETITTIQRRWNDIGSNELENNFATGSET